MLYEYYIINAECNQIKILNLPNKTRAKLFSVFANLLILHFSKRGKHLMIKLIIITNIDF